MSDEIEMPRLESVSMNYGEVAYYPEIEAKAATTERQAGNVTIHNAAQPGTPGYFKVTYFVTANLIHKGVEFTHFFHWPTILPGLPGATSYRDIEGAGAKQLAPMLRAVADALEKDVARVDAERAERHL